MKKKLTELREKLAAKRAHLSKAFELGGSDVDFAQKSVLSHLGVEDSAGAVVKVLELNKELDDIYAEASGLAELEKVESGLSDHRFQGTVLHPAQGPGPAGDIGAARNRLSIGEVITQHDHYAAKNPLGFRVDDYGVREIKNTLFQTSAGWDPEDFRIGRMVDAATRPIQVLDIIPVGRTDNSNVVYMEETTRTHAAVEKAEGGTFAESTFELTERTSPVRKITDSIPVTDEQLEDVAMVESYLNQRLRFGLRQRLDGQIVGGNGTAPNLRGITNTTGIATQPKGTDPTPDAIYKAMTKVSLAGRANPDYVLLHHNDWQEIRLLRTADGIYIWGNPSMRGPETIWGLPVVKTDTLTEGTGLVGDFGNWCMLFERRGIDVQVGFSGTQFVEGKQTIRADMRAAFVVFRTTAFATITGI